jgi:hypothetical protein
VQFFNITEAAKIFWVTFTQEKFLTKNVAGYISGEFLTNSSGHPAMLRNLRTT